VTASSPDQSPLTFGTTVTTNARRCYGAAGQRSLVIAVDLGRAIAAAEMPTRQVTRTLYPTPGLRGGSEWEVAQLKTHASTAGRTLSD
jgi:hypothetical protein